MYTRTLNESVLCVPKISLYSYGFIQQKLQIVNLLKTKLIRALMPINIVSINLIKIHQLLLIS